MTGTVYLVGAGPGAPDLLTLRAARLLAAADIVFHDALVHPDTLALAERAEKIAVGKRCGKHSTAQKFINKRLVDAARGHSIVVRLKGGDPMLFGRAQEEIAALETAGVRYEVVPGVTAALAAARGWLKASRPAPGYRALLRPTPGQSTWAPARRRRSPRHSSPRASRPQRPLRSSRVPRWNPAESLQRLPCSLVSLASSRVRQSS